MNAFDQFLDNPEADKDRLPQPFRFISRLVSNVIEDALLDIDIILHKERTGKTFANSKGTHSKPPTHIWNFPGDEVTCLDFSDLISVVGLQSGKISFRMVNAGMLSSQTWTLDAFSDPVIFLKIRKQRVFVASCKSVKIFGMSATDDSLHLLQELNAPQFGGASAIQNFSISQDAQYFLTVHPSPLGKSQQAQAIIFQMRETLPSDHIPPPAEAQPLTTAATPLFSEFFKFSLTGGGGGGGGGGGATARFEFLPILDDNSGEMRYSAIIYYFPGLNVLTRQDLGHTKSVKTWILASGIMSHSVTEVDESSGTRVAVGLSDGSIVVFDMSLGIQTLSIPSPIDAPKYPITNVSISNIRFSAPLLLALATPPPSISTTALSLSSKTQQTPVRAYVRTYSLSDGSLLDTIGVNQPQRDIAAQFIRGVPLACVFNTCLFLFDAQSHETIIRLDPPEDTRFDLSKCQCFPDYLACPIITETKSDDATPKKSGVHSIALYGLSEFAFSGVPSFGPGGPSTLVQINSSANLLIPPSLKSALSQGGSVSPTKRGPKTVQMSAPNSSRPPDGFSPSRKMSLPRFSIGSGGISPPKKGYTTVVTPSSRPRTSSERISEIGQKFEQSRAEREKRRQERTSQFASEIAATKKQSTLIRK